MDQTTGLELPYIMPAQAQKHVTHNEALRKLDALVQLAVINRTQAVPPPSPTDGARYIVGEEPSGAWSGRSGQIAAMQDGAWAFFTPKNGWRAWVEAEDLLLVRRGDTWSPIEAAITSTPFLGVNASADAGNRLTVASPATLFNHEGEGHQLKLNKAAAGNTASLLMQDNFSGRAEMGLAGDDNFHFKVSGDGTAWKDALMIDASSGKVSMPYTPAELAAPVTITPDASPESFFTKFDPSPIWSDAPLYTTAIARFDGGNDHSDVPSSDAYGAARTSPNIVATWGWNFQSGGGRIDTTKPAWGFSLEYNYFDDPLGTYKRGVEGHWKLQDTSGVEHRPITMWLPWDGYSGSGINFSCDTLRLTTFDPAASDNLRVTYNFNTANLNQIHFHVRTEIRIESNNTPVIRQANAAGSDFSAHWYLDNFDRLLSGQPVIITGATPDAARSSLFSINGSSLTSGQYMLRLDWANAVTGPVNALYVAGQCSGDMLDERANYGSGNAVFYAHSWTNDAIVRFKREGGLTWASGLDGSDSDKWKLSRSSNVGTNDTITADENAVAFGVPARLKPCTVATLPSASNAGAGSLVYVTDASGGPTLACSDGTNWKVVAVLGATVS